MSTEHGGMGRFLASCVLVAVLAAGVRIACWARAPLIGTDSARFLLAAERFERGEHFDAVQDAYHPLTAYLIAQVHRLLGGQRQPVPVDAGERDATATQRQRERAAACVTILAGVLAVVLLMGVVRRSFPSIPPWSVGVLAACQPYLVRSSADIMSDPVFLACLLLALREGLRVPTGGGLTAAFSAGGATGMAYLARPEGLVLLGALPLAWWAWHLTGSVRPVGRARARSAARDEARAAGRPAASPGVPVVRGHAQRWLWCAALVAGAAPLIAPYLGAISIIAGDWTVTLKKDLLAVVMPSWLAAGPAGAPREFLEGLGELARQWVSTATPPVALAALVGLIACVQRRPSVELGGPLWLWGMIVLGFGVVLLQLMLVQGVDYLSRRHVFVLVALSLPLSVAGFQALGRGVVRGLGATLGARADAQGIGMALVLLTAVALLPKALQAQRLDQRAQLEVAAFLLAQERPDMPVLTPREKVPYYARASYQPLPGRIQRAALRVRLQSEAWLVFYRFADERRCPGLGDWARAWTGEPPGLELVACFPEPGAEPPDELLVYRWRRWPASEEPAPDQRPAVDEGTRKP